ncbi:MAG: hypothetical protein HHJ14_14430 [Cellulomonas sp.]|uniref:type IV toxin-antitoxin system AbiEi family antitoxin n=1 Tax=Cellulomonas sp. TaxID=40001 RepID=UPI0017B596D8|nr:type IV toxin-antitoxin system AbiEi family antitoxin [Cellulomonas sp.]NMM18266.1 hypothetical protein [Cellulomonas sp.]NMM29853.1 hypothetical protein [Cellulomonas sp.]
MTNRIAARPMRVVRPVDLEAVYVNPRAVLAKQATNGTVHKVARGVFVAPPDTVRDPLRWRPGFEAAAGAVGTATFGPDAIVAVGMTAARMHGVVPRARAVADLAAPARHRPVKLTDRPHGIVRFVTRDIGALDTRPMATELGALRVTTPEQTLVDLAAHVNHNDPDVRDAMRALARKVDWDKVHAIAAHQYGARKAQPHLRALERTVTE